MKINQRVMEGTKMALSQDILSFIKDMNFEEGDGVLLEGQKKAPIKNPALFIGLGGSGCKALRVLKRRINREFIRDNGQVPSNFSFLGIDTDIRVFSAPNQYNDMMLEKEEKFSLGEEAAKIKDLLLNNGKIDFPWFDQNLSGNKHIILGGAGSIRQYGKLTLMGCGDKLKSKFDNIITKLVTENSKSMYIFIITGIGGGTGSGIFLDTSYILRDSLEKWKRKTKGFEYYINGYIILPDVIMQEEGIFGETDIIERIKINSFAALKELDYWMGAEERKEEYGEQYEGFAIKMDEAKNPFDHCWLFSAIDADGKLLRNPAKRINETISSNIEAWISENTSISDKEHTQGLDSFINNERALLHNMIDNLGRIGTYRPVSYVYSACGAATNTLPRVEINTYLAAKLIKEVMVLNSYSKNDTTTDRINVINNLKLDIGNKRKDLMNAVSTAGTNIDLAISPTDIQNVPGDYDEVIKRMSRSLDKISSNIGDAMKSIYNECVRDLDKLCEKYFLSIDKGPFYLRVFLENGFSSGLSFDFNQLSESARKAILDCRESINLAKQRRTKHKNDVENSNSIGLNKKFRVYVNSAMAWYNEEKNARVLEGLEKLYSMLSLWAHNKASGVYRIVEDTLNALSKVCNNNYDKIITKADHVSDGTLTTYSWEIMNTGELVDKVDNWMSEHKSSELILREFLEDLYRYILKCNIIAIQENEAENLKSEKFDIKKFLSDHISGKFGDLVNRTMRDYIDEKARLYQGGEDKFFTDMFDDLMKFSTPVFTADMSNCPKMKVIILPREYPRIIDEWEKYKEDKAFEAKSIVDMVSSDVNSISLFNVFLGLPLFAWSGIMDIEALYYDKVAKQVIRGVEFGVHLRMGVGGEEDWYELPCPIPVKEFSENLNMERVDIIKSFNNARSLFDEMVVKEVLFFIEKDKFYYRYVKANPTFTLEHITKQHDLGDIDAGEVKREEIERVIKKLNLLRDIITGKAPLSEVTVSNFGCSFIIKEYPIPQSGNLDSRDPSRNEINTEMAKDHFANCYHGKRRIKETANLLDEIDRTISKITIAINSIREKRELIIKVNEAILAERIYSYELGIRIKSSIFANDEYLVDEDIYSKPLIERIDNQINKFKNYFIFKNFEEIVYEYKNRGREGQELIDILNKEIDDAYRLTLRDKGLFKSKVADMLKKLEKQRISSLVYDDDKDLQSKMKLFYSISLDEITAIRDTLEEEI